MANLTAVFAPKYAPNNKEISVAYNSGVSKAKVIGLPHKARTRVTIHGTTNNAVNKIVSETANLYFLLFHLFILFHLSNNLLESQVMLLVCDSNVGQSIDGNY